MLDTGDIGHISKETATVVANHPIAPWLNAKGYVDVLREVLAPPAAGETVEPAL